MSWLTKLCETYNNCAMEAGKYVEGKRPLLPLDHTTQTAHLEIRISETGDFLDVRTLEKEEALTIVPVTEGSVGRTSNLCPHPLNDQLKYIAADLYTYLIDTNATKNNSFELYLNQLKAWVAFDSTNKKLNAILAFISKRNLTKELIDRNIFLLDESGYLVLKPKSTKNIPRVYSLVTGQLQNVFCRFCVECEGEVETKTFADTALFDSWHNYYLFKNTASDLCYATGKLLPVALGHARFIRTTGDGAKLISSNDTDNFTFRGIFTKDEQASMVSHEVSDKAHSALKWLLSKQAYSKGNLVVLVWSSGGSDVPSLTYDILDSDERADTAEAYALKVTKSLAGYKQKLQDSDDINIICLDSANGEKGRLAVTYYREFGCADFIERLNKWYLTCAWPIRLYGEEGFYDTISTPTPIQIINTAYGKHADDSLIQASLKRIVPCIIDGASLPLDFVLKAVNRVSNKESFEKETDWNKALSITCALYRKYKQKEDYSMLLDENRNTRDYLYGRLLAIAENIEEWALSNAGEKRATTASRYFTQFASNPYKTWGIIYSQLQPYIAKLEGKASGRIKMIDEIMGKFSPEDYLSNKKLSGEYLLGYHNQRQALHQKKAEQNTENNSENNLDEVKDNE